MEEFMREKTAIIICVMICITLIICGILYWPTLYHYDKLYGKLPVRMNRLTGYTEILYADGWRSVKKQKETQLIPVEEFAKIKSKGTFDNKGNYNFIVYNGTAWTLTKIRLSLTNESGLTIYETYVHISPFSTDDSCIVRHMLLQDPYAQFLHTETGGKTFSGSKLAQGKGQVGEYLGPIEEKTNKQGAAFSLEELQSELKRRETL